MNLKQGSEMQRDFIHENCIFLLGLKQGIVKINDFLADCLSGFSGCFNQSMCVFTSSMLYCNDHSKHHCKFPHKWHNYLQQGIAKCELSCGDTCVQNNKTCRMQTEPKVAFLFSLFLQTTQSLNVYITQMKMKGRYCHTIITVKYGGGIFGLLKL